jgi:hypothetical protein
MPIFEEIQFKGLARLLLLTVCCAPTDVKSLLPEKKYDISLFPPKIVTIATILTTQFPTI